MKITIENVKEKEKGWFGEKPIHKLYITLEITNEERFVLETKVHLQRFKLVEGVAGDDGRELPSKPTIYSSRLLDTNFSGSQIRGVATRMCIFSHPEIDWANYNQDLLEAGLKKWKEAIETEAKYQEKRPEKKTLEL